MNIEPFFIRATAKPASWIASSSLARTAHTRPRAHRFDDAMRLMEDGRWQTAFTLLAQLADAGHPQAARIALLFVRRGALLFGGHYCASAPQRERWERAID